MSSMLPLLLIGGAALILSKPKKKSGNKKKSAIDSVYKKDATVGGVADLVALPVGIRKEGSDITFKDFIEYPTDAKKILFAFPDGFPNAEVAGTVASARMFSQGPNFGKLITDKGDFELPGTGNVASLVTNINADASQIIFEEMRARVTTGNEDFSMDSMTRDKAIDAALAKVGVTVPVDADPTSKGGKVRQGASLLAQLAYQSVWNQGAVS